MNEEMTERQCGRHDALNRVESWITFYGNLLAYPEPPEWA